MRTTAPEVALVEAKGDCPKPLGTMLAHRTGIRAETLPSSSQEARIKTTTARAELQLWAQAKSAPTGARAQHKRGGRREPHSSRKAKSHGAS